MQRNVNKADRILRFALGLAVLSLIFLGPQTSWGYIGLIAVITAMSGFCPIYRIFGIGKNAR